MKKKPQPKKKASRRAPRRAHKKRLKKFETNDTDEYYWTGEEYNPLTPLEYFDPEDA